MAFGMLPLIKPYRQWRNVDTRFKQNLKSQISHRQRDWQDPLSSLAFPIHQQGQIGITV